MPPPPGAPKARKPKAPALRAHDWEPVKARILEHLMGSRRPQLCGHMIGNQSRRASSSTS
jgi:hypothetical protein